MYGNKSAHLQLIGYSLTLNDFSHLSNGLMFAYIQSQQLRCYPISDVPFNIVIVQTLGDDMRGPLYSYTTSLEGKQIYPINHLPTTNSTGAKLSEALQQMGNMSSAELDYKSAFEYWTKASRH